ncbi:M50 family metallopeptidase [Candidatus Absconditicoccus praedator]|uniref:M50 family metallopeptidase n=1 Tax=Candidatus Absconditicoccus praedator TaxID=2735562 RepID=UPI001E4FFD3E|nr:site-2 protease family protein [Candidatus Absconditicoccus praedator]UFX82834.1 site-2 protease family protein [Candidatus Absconditicoccus praedator]
MWTAIIAGILLFMFLVVVHEFGHFIAAKKSGVKVLEFGIGIPPKAFTFYKDKDGTEYTINWLPLGGFVRLKGENPDDTETFHAKDSFITQNLFKKVLILVGGVAVNLLFAWLFFTAAFWKGIEPISIVPESMLSIDPESYMMPTQDFLDRQGLLSGDVQHGPIKVQQVLPDSIAEDVGIMSGTVITSISGQEVDTSNLQSVLRENIGKEIQIGFEKDGQKYEEKAECQYDRCLLGIAMKQYSDIEVLPMQFGLWGGMAAGAHEIKAQTRLTFHVLGNIFSQLITFEREKARDAVENLAGPVGAVKVGEIILDEFGFWQYLAFGGMISLALAIFNALPIPALDGGRLVGAIIQSVGKLKPEKYFVVEGYMNLLFFVLLMSLGIYIIFLDLARFWGVNPFGM